MQTEDQKNWTNDDLAICSYILVRGANFLGASSDRPGHFVFVFENPEKCEEFKRDFFNNGLVAGRELLARRDELLTEIKNQNQNGDKHANT